MICSYHHFWLLITSLTYIPNLEKIRTPCLEISIGHAHPKLLLQYLQFHFVDRQSMGAVWKWGGHPGLPVCSTVIVPLVCVDVKQHWTWTRWQKRGTKDKRNRVSVYTCLKQVFSFCVNIIQGVFQLPTIHPIQFSHLCFDYQQKDSLVASWHIVQRLGKLAIGF